MSLIRFKVVRLLSFFPSVCSHCLITRCQRHNYFCMNVIIDSLVVLVRTLNPKKCNFNAPAIRKNFFSKFDKYNILAF